MLYLTDRLPKPSYDSENRTLRKKTTENTELRNVEAEDEMITSQASLPEPQKNSKSVPKIPNEKSLKQKVNHENKHSRDNSLPILRENQELEKPQSSKNSAVAELPNSRGLKKS